MRQRAAAFYFACRGDLHIYRVVGDFGCRCIEPSFGVFGDLAEATISIDTRTEIKIQSAFAALMKGRTSFIVAHRLSTIREADLILVMKDGNIIEQGTHSELLKKEGFYANLYNSQFAQ